LFWHHLEETTGTYGFFLMLLGKWEGLHTVAAKTLATSGTNSFRVGRNQTTVANVTADLADLSMLWFGHNTNTTVLKI
jgi:hypothetical protein